MTRKTKGWLAALGCWMCSVAISGLLGSVYDWLLGPSDAAIFLSAFSGFALGIVGVALGIFVKDKIDPPRLRL